MFNTSFENSKRALFREQKEDKHPTNPLFSQQIEEKSKTQNSQVWAINDKYDLYSWRQGVRTYTTAEPTHEPHPHFGSINGEHIEIVPVNMNTFLRPLLLRRSEF